MNKNLKLTFILSLILFAIVIAWNTFVAYFSGAGINFIAVLGLFVVILALYLTDNYVRSRTKELFIVSAVFTGLEFIVYLVTEFRIGGYEGLYAFSIVQSVYAMFAIVFFAYTIFRLFAELKGVKFGFIETILGNNKAERKAKKAKEFANGSLEEKPSKVVVESEDEEIIVGDEAEKETVDQQESEE